MGTIVLVLLVLALGLWALKFFSRVNTAVLAKRMQYWGGIAALGIAAILVFRGGLSVAIPVAGLGLWLLGGGRPFSAWGRRQGSQRSGSGQTSTVKTATLEMELDHVTGEMRGRVLKGFFAGRDLEQLKPVELAHLWQDCRFADPQSAQLMEAYLDRVHPSWREDLARADASAPKGPDGRMTRAEALELLGLAEGASPEAIREAHRNLMLKLHPDRGGSNYLAAKINEAKDVALGA